MSITASRAAASSVMPAAMPTAMPAVSDYIGRHRRASALSICSGLVAIVGIPVTIGLLMLDRRQRKHSHRRR